jgi:hypothetical protein
MSLQTLPRNRVDAGRNAAVLVCAGLCSPVQAKGLVFSPG